MKLEKVKELVELMKANDLNELEITDGDTRVVLKRGVSQAAPQVVAMSPIVPVNGHAAGADSLPAGLQTAGADAAVTEVKDTAEIVAPLVGTFYSTASPNAEPFLEVGSKVDTDTVVCIIEAMKVMNEVKSEIKGTITKVLVENGAAVEFGEPLFLVEPD